MAPSQQKPPAAGGGNGEGKKLDVYRDWLKISATNRPLNYYQILKLKMFEDDPAVIRKHYRELNAYIRKFATGDYIEESQKLLNTLAKAMLCLTDHERKEEYDFALGRKGKEIEGPRTLETILLQNKVVTPEQIKKAKGFSDAVGIDLHQALLQQRAAKPEEIMLAYAESIGLPFIDLNDVPVDEYYAPQMDPNTARQHSFVPVMADMGKLILASPEPISLDVEDELRLLFDLPVRCAICTPSQINAAIAKYYPRDAVQRLAPKGDRGAKAAIQAAASPDDQKPSRKAKEPKPPMSQAAQKNRKKVALISFNFGFMAVAFARYFLVRNPKFLTEVLPWALAAGVIAFGIGWLLSPREVAEEEEE